MPLPEELQWGEIAQRLVRADGVVGFLPLPQFAIEGCHLQRAVGNLVELLGMGPLSTFDRPVEFG
jgi:hypothetical protein